MPIGFQSVMIEYSIARQPIAADRTIRISSSPTHVEELSYPTGEDAQSNKHATLNGRMGSRLGAAPMRRRACGNWYGRSNRINWHPVSGRWRPHRRPSHPPNHGRRDRIPSHTRPLGSPRERPPHRRFGHAVDLRQFGLRLAVAIASGGNLDLFGREPPLRAELRSLGLRAGDALVAAFADQFTFELDVRP